MFASVHQFQTVFKSTLTSQCSTFDFQQYCCLVRHWLRKLCRHLHFIVFSFRPSYEMKFKTGFGYPGNCNRILGTWTGDFANHSQKRQWLSEIAICYVSYSCSELVALSCDIWWMGLKMKEKYLAPLLPSDAVLAQYMVRPDACPSVRPSVCHKPVMY